MKIFNRVSRSNEKGLTLLETVVALAVLGLVAIAILTALATGVKATTIAREQALAESLARSEMEYVKQAPYVPGALTYPIDASIVPAAEGWDIPGAVVEPVPGRDSSIQKITITVWHNERSILSLADYKGNR